jgi:hypothetical protein
MPYNPEDPNSDPNNPEGGAHLPTPGLELTTEEKVRICHPQAVIREQRPEVLQTVEKMHAIWEELRDKKITQSDANKKLDQLVAGDIAEYVTDPIAIGFINDAVESIRNPNPAIS